MAKAALDLDKLGGVVRAASLLDERPQERADERAEWGLAEVSGRLVELSAGRQGAALTAAMGLVWQAQKTGEPTAWVLSEASTFYPPDAARSGVDLDTLAVVRADGGKRAARAADRLARSGAFGLVVIDLGEDRPPDGLMRRLQKWAERHEMAIVCLSDREPTAGVLSPLVSLRAVATCERVGEDRFACNLEAVRDKERGPGWRHEEVCCGPPGLR